MSDNNQSIDYFGQQIIKLLTNIDFTSILPRIEEVIRTSISNNFKAQGRYGNDNKFGGGSTKWTPSQRALKGGGKNKTKGMTLSDTGQLAASIRVKAYCNNGQIFIEVGSNKPYAPIHQFGGTINRAAHSKTYVQNKFKRGPKKGQFKKGTTAGQGSTVGAYKINIIARPYLVIQNEDVQEIHRIIQEYLKSIFL